MTAFDLLNRFQPYLFPGERVLWSGVPKRGLSLRGADAYLVPFSLVWTGFVISMFIQTVNLSGSPDFILIIFLAVGIYMTVGRFFHDALIRGSLIYGVTNQRVLTLRGRRFRKLTSLDIRHLPKLELTQFGDGSGTISFESQDFFGSWTRSGGFAIWVPSLNAGSQFFRIRDARPVYELIRNQVHSPA